MRTRSKKFGRLIAMSLSIATCLSCEQATTWESHWEKGNIYFEQRDFVRAETELKASLRLAESEAPPQEKETRSLIALGKLCDIEHRFDDTLRYFERALQIIENALGQNHAELSMPLKNIGAVHAIQHHYDRALSYFDRAFAIEDGRSSLSERVKPLAAVYASRAEYLEAEPFLSRVLELPKPNLKETDKETANYLDNYARLHTAQIEYSKAKPYLDALDPAEGVELPRNLQDPSASLLRLTSLLGTPTKFEKAETRLLAAHEATEKTGGQLGIQVARGLSELADFYLAWGKIDTAIPLLERSFAIASSSAPKKVGDPLSSLPSPLATRTDNHLAAAAEKQRYALALRTATRTALKNVLAK